MIPFLNLNNINAKYSKDIEKAFGQVLNSGHYILGEQLTRFENAFAQYCGTKYCLGVGNGLDALTLILKAYIHISKLQKGDKVIVPANTFIATILSVLHAELKPVFVEPNPKTFNIDVDAVENQLKSNNSIKAIVMVHLYGQLANAEKLLSLSKKHNVLLIEDAAQAHGAELELNTNNFNLKNIKAGNLSDAAAFSFYPTKNLGALGDAGAITTNNKNLYNAITLLRNYGSNKKYHHQVIGYNSRLDDVQASILNVKLKNLDKDNLIRQHIAKRYLTKITNPKITLPFYNNSKNHVFYAFVIRVKNRNQFCDYLDNNNIGWLIHYPTPPHKQKALINYTNLNLPITEELHNQVISLPLHPVLTDNEVTTIIQVINNY